MKLLIYSDLHLEFDGFQPKKEWLQNVDLVIQVGDLQHAPNNINILKSWEVPVLFVPGNHDFWNPMFSIPDPYSTSPRHEIVYKHHLLQAVEKMKEAAFGSMVHVLYNDVIEFGGIQFLGTTLWYDALKLSKPESMHLNDYYRIFMAQDKPIQREFIAEEHLKATQFIRETLAVPFDGKRVLLTHHPAWIPPIVWDEYGPLGKAYGTDLSRLWKGNIDLMVHGHVHDNIDTRIEQTRILCNPRGYPREDTRRTFKKQLVFNL
jgi:predicted phosphodiesterase